MTIARFFSNFGANAPSAPVCTPVTGTVDPIAMSVGCLTMCELSLKRRPFLSRCMWRKFSFNARNTLLAAPCLFRPPGTTVPDGLIFCPWCFFFSPRFLRDPSTDRPETLPHDRNLAVFYKLTSKLQGCSPQKIWGPKTCKIAVNFRPLQTLIVNISGTRQHIQNRKDVRIREIPPAFDEKSPVNFGPLTAWNYMWVWTRGISEKAWRKKNKETSLVKHKPVRNGGSGRPNNVWLTVKVSVSD